MATAKVAFRYRQCNELRRRGLGYREIATKLKIPVQAVRNYLHKGEQPISDPGEIAMRAERCPSCGMKVVMPCLCCSIDRAQNLKWDAYVLAKRLKGEGQTQ